MSVRFVTLRIIALLTTAVALFVIVHVAASAPGGDGKRLGLRGLKRQRALQTAPFWTTLEPIVRWIGARSSGLISEETRKGMNQKISLAGDFLGLLPEEVVGLSVLTAIGGLGVGALAGSLTGMGNILVIAGLLMGAAMPSMRISEAAAERMKRVDRRLPSAIDLLALAMGAGLDVPGSVRQGVEKSGAPDDPVVEDRVWPTAMWPTRSCRMSPLNTWETRPLPTCLRNCRPSLVTSPALSCPRCWSANRP